VNTIGKHLRLLMVKGDWIFGSVLNRLRRVHITSNIFFYSLRALTSWMVFRASPCLFVPAGCKHLLISQNWILHKKGFITLLSCIFLGWSCLWPNTDQTGIQTDG